MTIIEKIGKSSETTLFTIYREAINPNISSPWKRDTSANSFNMIFHGEMCKRYVLLPMSGIRNNSNGLLYNVGNNGNYWSSTVSSTNSCNLNFNSSNANMNDNIRANGTSVRCLKDCLCLGHSPFLKFKYYKTTTKIILIIWSLFFSSTTFAQTLSGNLSLLSNQEIKLEGFAGLKTYPISSTKIDEKGNFSLNFSKVDHGVGYLISSDNKPLFVILSSENIEIVGEALSHTESIRTIHGQENMLFEQYAREHPLREQALSAWLYLEKMYQHDSLFSGQEVPKNVIMAEKRRIKMTDTDFLASLPKGSYISWFLPVRKLVSSVSVVAQYRTEEIPATMAAFRSVDYADQRLYKSGLLRDAIESHFWLIENSGRSLDSVAIEMKISIDHLIKNLARDEKKFNEITGYLFELLERHSLFDASEYLALKVLNEVSCTIDGNLAKQLETYRIMKKGNIAPDLNFKGDVFTVDFAGSATPQKLSDIKSDYVLLFFGASWCPKCMEELPQINSVYAKWKAKNVEVVFVSMDEDKTAFKNAAEKQPFISVCDYQKWKSPMAEAYYVFATPTFYLLNNKREILLRPNSVKQMDAWVDSYLVQDK